jgi:pimeloyl-ACP methyl ester carboxylesterase
LSGDRGGSAGSRDAVATVHRIRSGDVELAVEDTGGGLPIVVAHGLTATRRYVLHGSRLLARAGYRVVSYDARGHGESSAPLDRTAYAYDELVADLEAVIDGLGIDQAVVGGSSMGAATTLVYALRHPDRVSALTQITPAYRGRAGQESRERAYEWDELADALERDGVEGFMRAYGDPPVADRFKGIVQRAVRARIERHRDVRAVADALRVVVRSLPFDSAEELDQIHVPTLVVASHDEADPEHPFEVAEEYARRIPNAELVTEEPGASPIAWRGAQLSRAIRDFLERHGLGP